MGVRVPHRLCLAALVPLTPRAPLGGDGVDDLAVARYLQEATGISIARIVRELRSLQEVTINLNGHHLAAAPRLTDTADDILTALSTPPPAH